MTYALLQSATRNCSCATTVLLLNSVQITNHCLHRQGCWHDNMEHKGQDHNRIQSRDSNMYNHTCMSFPATILLITRLITIQVVHSIIMMLVLLLVLRILDKIIILLISMQLRNTSVFLLDHE